MVLLKWDQVAVGLVSATRLLYCISLVSDCFAACACRPKQFFTSGVHNNFSGILAKRGHKLLSFTLKNVINIIFAASALS